MGPGALRPRLPAGLPLSRALLALELSPSAMDPLRTISAILRTGHGPPRSPEHGREEGAAGAAPSSRRDACSVRRWLPLGHPAGRDAAVRRGAVGGAAGQVVLQEEARAGGALGADGQD